MTRPSDAARINRAYYDQLSAGRDDYWRKMAAPRHRAAVIGREVERARPATVVDLGCGSGALLDELARALPGATLAGIDLSGPQIAENRASRPGVLWHAADLERPIAWAENLSSRFDAVVASEIIEHLDRPEQLLQNALALARPGRGRLVLSTQSGCIRATERRVGHRRHYRPDAMRALLRAAGWLPVRVWNTGFPFHDLSKWYANRDPDRSMERFGNRAYGPSENAICLALRLAFRLNSARRGAQLFAVAVAPDR